MCDVFYELSISDVIIIASITTLLLFSCLITGKINEFER